MSFSRVIGALMVLSVVAGWWFALLGSYQLPELTEELLLFGLFPYLGNRLSGALRR